MNEKNLEVRGLRVGYDKNAVAEDISFSLAAGEVLAVIGPNGAGKSTLLNTVARLLSPLGGVVRVCGEDARARSAREFAKLLSVLRAERVRPERMTCLEVAAAGRYPHTGFFGALTQADLAAAREALASAGASALAERDFSRVSDGQRQRVLLARALCQTPRVLVLDEPTSCLDLAGKAEILAAVRDLARAKGMSVLLSLHELDLAVKVADDVLCVGGGRAFLTKPERVDGALVRGLYGAEGFDPLSCSCELPRLSGAPRVFVLAGGGTGTPAFRALRRKGIPFAAGILPESDADFPAASALAAQLFRLPPFACVGEEDVRAAMPCVRAAGALLVCAPYGQSNAESEKLEGAGVPVFRKTEDFLCTLRD